MKIYEIIPHKLYQSKKTHDELDALDTLNKLKISVVVNLWHTVDERVAQNVKYYYHYSIPDGKTLDFMQLDELASELLAYINAGEVVLSHCYGGRNRSGLLNALIVRKYMGISGLEAKKFIMSKRPNSLVNDYFCEILDELVVEQV